MMLTRIGLCIGDGIGLSAGTLLRDEFAVETIEMSDLSQVEVRGLACLIVGCPRPDRDGLAQLAPVRRFVADGVPTVLVCGELSESDARRAMRWGASGLVLDKDLETSLVPAVAAVAADQICVPRGRASVLAAPVLTTREREILSLVVMGLPNAEIARRLFLAESTVKSHLSSAFAKLGVSSRNEAVNVILDPERGKGMGILTIPAERIPSAASWGG
jgi:DNA-binding NarL/FixJ family response regulator